MGEKCRVKEGRNRIFMFMFAGLAFTVFLYVASIIVPILFFVVLAGFLWIRYKQRKAVKLMFERNAGRERQHPRGEIIDAEYEIIDDNKH